MKKIRIIEETREMLGDIIDFTHVFELDGEDSWFHVNTVFDDTDPLSVILAKSLYRYGYYDIDIDKRIEDEYCEICGYYEDIITKITVGDETIEVFEDSHLGYNKGCTNEELIKDWKTLGYDVEIINYNDIDGVD